MTSEGASSGVTVFSCRAPAPPRRSANPGATILAFTLRFGEPRLLLALDLPRALASFAFDLLLRPFLLFSERFDPPRRTTAANADVRAAACARRRRGQRRGQQDARRRSSHAHVAIVDAVSSAAGGERIPATVA